MNVPQTFFKQMSFSLHTLLKSYRTLSKSPSKLSPNLKFTSNPDVQFDYKPENTLNLNHPLLQKLESCCTLAQLHQVQAQLIIFNLLHHPLSASHAIKKLSSLPHTLNLAVSLLEKLEKPDAFMCNTIIRSYLNKGELESGLNFYYRYVIGGFIVPNHYTFPLIIKICGDLGSGLEGEKAHCRVFKDGFGLDLYATNSLIRMYSVFGRMEDAQKAFDESPESDLVTWNTMIDGYVKNGQVGLARNMFDEMRERDLFTWNSMLAGFVGVGNMDIAIELFGSMPCRDVVSWNCLLDGCSRTGDVSAAGECFNRMPVRNVVSWNTMLALLVRCKEYDQCLRLFDRMIKEGDALPNEATLVSVLTACGYLCRLDQGKWVHHYIESNKGLKSDVLLSTSLLTMYTKCGDMNMAEKVFNSMPEKSVVSWNSMIMGYGSHGLGDKAIEMFMEMEKGGQTPNDSTFVCVLAACAHSGKVLEGWWYFDVMRNVYKIEPKVEHYGCMVDLFGRLGLLKDAEELVKEIPVKGGSALWGALLSACHSHSNSQIGELVGRVLIGKEPEDIGAYLLLSNIYASEGRWEDVDRVRTLMVKKGFQKITGCSVACSGEGVPRLKDVPSHRKNMINSMSKQMGAQVKIVGD